MVTGVGGFLHYCILVAFGGERDQKPPVCSLALAVMSYASLGLCLQDRRPALDVALALNFQNCKLLFL